MRAIGGLWRWRHNPLRRGTDLAECWLALTALLLLLVAAPLTGLLAGTSAQHALQRAVREQRETRHQVTATVVRRAAGSPLDPDPETSTARDRLSRVVADWTAPDGTSRRTTVMADLEAPEPGDRFPVWTDARGRLMGPPLDPATATAHAVLAGSGAAVLAAGAIEGARRLILWRMLRRRYDRLDQAWERVGPDWGRTGAGS